MPERETVTVEESRYGWLGGERCQDCGKRYRMPWYAPDEVWLAIMKGEGGMLCPECFDRLAACRGYNLYWSCAIGNYPGDLPKALLKQMALTEMADVGWKRAEAKLDTARQRRLQAEVVVDATDLITDVMCADSRIPDWHRNRLREIVDTRNAYHAQKEVDRADL